MKVGQIVLGPKDLQGETFCAVWVIALFMVRGARQTVYRFSEVLAVNGSVNEWLSKVLELYLGRFAVLQVTFAGVIRDEAIDLCQAAGRTYHSLADSEVWPLLNEGYSNLKDCDSWIAISTQVICPGETFTLTPLPFLRSSAVMPFDFSDSHRDTPRSLDTGLAGHGQACAPEC